MIFNSHYSNRAVTLRRVWEYLHYSGSCILLLCVQSGRWKAADKTPMGDYFGKVSRKFKDVEWRLNVGFGLFWHCILYNLDVYSYIICFFQYLVLSCVLMVILIVLQLLYMTVTTVSEQQTFTL